MRTHGVPQEILTDNGKVFTGRFGRNDAEVLFDRICRENGIDHLLTAPRSPDDDGQDRAVPSHAAPGVPDRAGVRGPGHARRPSSTPGSTPITATGRIQALGMATPASRFPADAGPARRRLRPAAPSAPAGLGLPQGRRERHHLGRLAGDQLRQAPRRPPRRRPPRRPQARDLGRRRTHQDRPAHVRQGGPQEARRTPRQLNYYPKRCNGSGEANPSRISRTLTGPPVPPGRCARITRTDPRGAGCKRSASVHRRRPTLSLDLLAAGQEP